MPFLVFMNVRAILFEKNCLLYYYIYYLEKNAIISFLNHFILLLPQKQMCHCKSSYSIFRMKGFKNKDGKYRKQFLNQSFHALLMRFFKYFIGLARAERGILFTQISVVIHSSHFYQYVNVKTILLILYKRLYANHEEKQFNGLSNSLHRIQRLV